MGKETTMPLPNGESVQLWQNWSTEWFASDGLTKVRVSQSSNPPSPAQVLKALEA